MVKPFKSHEFYSIFKKKLFIVNNIKQLKEKYEICKKHMIDVMLSEIIQGKDSNLYASYFYVDKNHQFVGGMTRQKLRQHPPKYGITNVSISKYNKTIFDLSEKFLKKIPNYSGIGYIEFKYDERDGKYKLIEMNARDVSWISLATSCGINFPFIQYNDMVKGKKVRITSFKENIYWIFLYNDVMDQFISKNRKLESFTFKEKASPYFHKKAFPIESLSDPKPMLFFWKSKLIGIFKRLIIKGFAHTICVFLMASLDIFE
jgi:predicted ATP-grasp superfamily ATP-dependent carboligase